MTHTTIRETSIRHAMWTRVNPAPRIFSAICSALARRGIGPLAAARLVGEREPAAGREPVVEHAQGGGRVVPEHDHVHAEHAIERSGKVRIEHVTRRSTAPQLQSQPAGPDRATITRRSHVVHRLRMIEADDLAAQDAAGQVPSPSKPRLRQLDLAIAMCHPSCGNGATARVLTCTSPIFDECCRLRPTERTAGMLSSSLSGDDDDWTSPASVGALPLLSPDVMQAASILAAQI